MVRNTPHISWKMAARALIAAAVVAAIGWSGVLYAANQSVQGAKKPDEFAFDGETLICASVDPKKIELRDKLTFILNKNIRLIRAPRQANRCAANGEIGG